MNRRILLAIGASSTLSLAGWRAQALTGRGAAAAVAVSSSIIAGLSWSGALVLGTFFVSSSALSRLTHDQTIAAKGSRRDEWQVLANGGVAALAGLVAPAIGKQHSLVLAAGALGAATADTWATEIGATSRQSPVLIVSHRCVPPGTSGGVTLRGTLAAVAGAVLIAGVAATTRPNTLRYSSIPVIALAGLAGSLIDSVLGELVQEQRYCPRCAKPTEARLHRCGTRTLLTGGMRGVDNDLVNLACTLTGALVVGLLDFLLSRSGRLSRL